MSTGNELHDLGQQAPNGASVIDCNRPALRQASVHHGFNVAVDLGIIRDTEDAVADALLKGADLADCIIATGGTSMVGFYLCS